MAEIKLDERGREQIPAWYGIAITTNKEKLIRGRIQTLAQMDKWKDQIFDIVLPTYIEVNDKGKEVEKFQITQVGYVHMILNSETWSALEMLRGIGFRAIMPAGAAQPIPSNEMNNVFKSIGREDLLIPLKEQPVLEKHMQNGETVKINKEGHVLFGQIGVVETIHSETKEVTIAIDLLGKQTTARVSVQDIESLD